MIVYHLHSTANKLFLCGILIMEVMHMKMNELDWATMVLVVIGAINWGLVGAFQFDLVQTVLGTSPLLAQVTYILIGVSGLYTFYKMIMMKK